MKRVNAACGCNKGNIRTNNEDNFYFNGKYLSAENDGLSHTLLFRGETKEAICFAVFDGMGGERYGELAAHAVASRLQALLTASENEREIPARLNGLVLALNDQVLDQAKEKLTRHIGATLAGLYFANDEVYAFNLGDSRAYLSRDKKLTQLSVDHVDRRVLFARRAKPSLTQYLGIDEDEFLVEPSIIQCELTVGDRFLLCSDGLTDMLTDDEIGSLLRSAVFPKYAVEALIAAALDRGGRDNITVIICEIQ